MQTVSIVTPWLGGASGPNSLLEDYAAAITGAVEVISVDNGSDPETAAALANAGGTYIRNDHNAGFAGANNQGYAAATGDVVVFLNSDVSGDARFVQAVAADVRDGALYGPSLGQQLVAGRWLPYLEGWCIAATRKTWERIVLQGDREIPYMHDDQIIRDGIRVRREPFGPWDAAAYPGPYWEDNDLCFRAAQAGISLVQTSWQALGCIAHKGGRTAGPLLRHARSFAANERTFTDRVLAALGDDTPVYTPAYMRYLHELSQPSDIQHHLPLLYSLARGNVVELGTRSGVSTAAFLAGVERRGGHVWSVDIDPASAQVAAGHPQWTFMQSDSRNLELPARVGPVDCLLIDSEHQYDVATAELALWGSCMAPGGVILMHDPETFPGVRRAAREFAAARGWPLTIVLPNNGMAVIEVPRAD